MISDCCLRQRINTCPPLPKTGYSNPRCYARSLNDCSDKLSGEHIVTKNVLQLVYQKGNSTIQGPKFSPDISEVSIGLESVKTKVLCKRHNESLSGLDSLAFKYFQFLLFDKDHSEYCLINGQELERWFLKTLIAFYNSGIAYNRIQGEWFPPEHWVASVFNIAPMPKVGGLYILSGDWESNRKNIALQPLDEKINNGVFFEFAGFKFIYCCDMILNLSNLGPTEDQVKFHPKTIVIQENDIQREIHTGWFGGEDIVFLINHNDELKL